MSFSLSSLLNPEPIKAPAEPHLSPTHDRRPSIPPIRYVQSPERQYATASSPHLAAQHHQQQPHHTSLNATAQEAAQALAALSSSSNASPPAQWYGSGAPVAEHAHDERRPTDHRPGSSSGFGAPIELPQPSDTRKMTSPNLDQYHVASRLPEQRRSSMVPPMQPGMTLPPMQGFASEQQRHPLLAQSLHSSQPTAPVVEAHEIPFTTTAQPISLGGTDQVNMGAHQTEPEVKVKPPSPSASTPLNTSTSNVVVQMDGTLHSPAHIKQEPIQTPQASSPIEARRSSIQPTDGDATTLKAVAALKSEHSLRVQSPLRESSVPMPSTEMLAPEQSTTSKKRPAPSKTKKGTATSSTRKAPPSKKRKVEPKRSATPSSVVSRPTTFKTGSSKGTPANSSPAPSNRSYSGEPNDDLDDDGDDDPDEDVEGSGDVYCICRKPDNGTFMIGCDGTCDDWFHGRCVGIEERDKNLIDKYMCPTCTQAGIGRTTWKRMCRRGGCRQPARVGKSKGGKDGSKYCSEECGVQYFREMVARTRGREEATKSRSSRRKNSIVGTERSSDHDLGARGGVLAAGEVKGLLDSSKTAQDFKKLGEGVLSPPATPDGKDRKEDNYTEAETRALASILEQKDVARHRHQLLKDRMKFVTLVKRAASRTTTEKELKPKDYCGYDRRLEWTEAQFKAWRESPVGTQAFDLDTLAVEKSSSGGDSTKTGDDMIEDENRVEVEFELCDRKKCARHLEWGKLAVDDLRFEMTDNSDHMRALDREEREIKERVALRLKTGNVDGEGSVEMHGLGIADGDAADKKEGVVDGSVVANGDVAENMEVDGPVQQLVEDAVMTTVESEPVVVVEAGEAMVVDAAS